MWSLEEICRCPRCREALEWKRDGLRCTGCDSRYVRLDGVPVLVLEESVQAPREPPTLGSPRAEPSGVLDRLRKLYLPHAPRLSFKTDRSRETLRRFIAGTPGQILNVGAGDTDYGRRVLNLDIAPYAGVDVVGAAERLPLRDECFDGVVLMAVLEHVHDAEQTLAEAWRVLKPGGALLVDVPFMQGLHAGPGDYRRYTEAGLRAELERHGFVVEESGVAVGPASAAAWVFAEFLALLLSGRSLRGYYLAKAVTMWIALPLKYADLWLERHPRADAIASAVWARAVRPVVV